MQTQAERWVEVSPSQFPHEAEGLRLVREALPDHAPYRAWSNFEFRDSQGKWHEVDLLVLGRRRLHLVELKYYSGTLRGDDQRWLRDGRRAEDSPLKLARRKAQRLASKLREELFAWAAETGTRVPDARDVIPFTQESVFLHHPGLTVAMSPQATIDLFALDGHESAIGLPGISQRLLEPPDLGNSQYSVGSNRDQIIAALMQRIGVVQRRQREVGSWVIDEEPLDDGEGWQDWPAFHRVARSDRARVRFFLTDPGAPKSEQQRVRRLAEHEYSVMSRLQHDGLLRPRDMVDADLGIGVVYPLDQRYQRLDLWLSDKGRGVPVATQLALLRQVAEALAYAHGNRVVHRGLTPQAVSVSDDKGAVRVLVGEWQSAGALVRENGASTASQAPDGVTSLLGAASDAAAASRRLTEVLHRAPRGDQLRAEVFQAPEGVFRQSRAGVDRVKLDVFAIGALAYYVLAGRAPASDRASLVERVRRDRGLDLAADVPQVPSTVRAFVLAATNPSVAGRTPDIRTFLEGLAAAERATGTTVDELVDPLDAPPGSVLDGRYQLERRLGAGSTAVGLLVTDLAAPAGQGQRVLKVALHDSAAARLTGEAEVLRGLDHPRLVRLVDGPVEVAGRRALVLESAGDSTLSDELQGRVRTSLDLLERWGTDLLEALVALDAAGVDHRDIKPANLGVRTTRGAKHLVLFDFSLSRAGVSAVNAGTPPYLDPFLNDRDRGRYDSAAERYSAAVVLFEMATGATPVFGADAATDPASIDDEVTLHASAFDPTLAEAFTGFFRRALARRAAERHHTAVQMLADWRSLFAPLRATTIDDPDERARRATAATLLTESGLSARALSALEPFGVDTVGALAAVDPVRLNRMSGVAHPTKQEIKSRATQWREQLAVSAPGRRPADGVPPTGQLDVAAAARTLLGSLGSSRAKSRRAAANLVLGLEGDLDAFASQSELAAALGVSRVRGTQQVDAMQQAWAQDDASRAVLDQVAVLVRDSLSRLLGVATVDELAADVRDGFGAPSDDEWRAPRLAAGLLRLGIDRLQALMRADAGGEPLAVRRRGGRARLVALDPSLLDAAEALGRAADGLVAQADAAGELLVARNRAASRLREAAAAALGDEASLVDDDARLLRLGVTLSHDAALSGSEELHGRDFRTVDALAAALRGLEGTERVKAHEIISRVRARFPAVSALPGRPQLDHLLEEAGLGLVFDPEHGGGYRSRTRLADTTGLESRAVTTVAVPTTTSISYGHLSKRLAESARARSFLALGVDGRRLDRAVDLLGQRHDARVVNVTEVLLAAMKRTAADGGVPWDVARAADAEAPGSRGAQGLAALVSAAVPAVDAAIEAASDQLDGAGPVLLVDASPLAHYGQVSRLSRWTDLSAPRRQAVWVLVPQLGGNQGAVLDGRPIPLAAPGQFVRVDEEWLAVDNTSASSSTTTGASS